MIKKYELPDVYFVGQGPGDPDWRAVADEIDEPDDDGAEQASPDVIAMLGFDPFEDDEEEKGYEAYQPSADPGVFIGVEIPLAVAKQLTVPDGNPAEDLHLTLAYIGKLSQVQDRLPAIEQVLDSLAPEHDSLRGQVSGTGRFDASESSDGKDVIYAKVELQGLAELREDLVQRLEAAGVPVSKNHDFTPHVTLTYIEPGAERTIEVPPLEVFINHLVLWHGDVRRPWLLGVKK